MKKNHKIVASIFAITFFSMAINAKELDATFTIHCAGEERLVFKSGEEALSNAKAEKIYHIRDRRLLLRNSPIGLSDEAEPIIFDDYNIIYLIPRHPLYQFMEDVKISFNRISGSVTDLHKQRHRFKDGFSETEVKFNGLCTKVKDKKF